MNYPCKYIIYDIETGGLYSHHNPIIEFAMIILDENLNETFRYETYVKPYYGKIIDPTTPFLQNIGDGKEILFEKYNYKFLNGGWRKELKVEGQALDANGIKMSDVMAKGIDANQLYKDLVKIFKENKSGRFAKPVLVGHNIGSFDNAFIEVIFDLYEPKRGYRDQSNLWNYVDSYFEDTLAIARKKWGHLNELENFQLGTVAEKLGIEHSNAHRALNDVEANTKIFIQFTKDLRNKAVGGVGEELLVEENFREGFQI